MAKVPRRRLPVDDDRVKEVFLQSIFRGEENWTRTQTRAALLLDLECETMTTVAQRLAPSKIVDVCGDWPGHQSLQGLRLCTEFGVALACGMPSGFPMEYGSADAGTPLQNLFDGSRHTVAVDSRNLLEICVSLVRDCTFFAQLAAREAVNAPWPWTSPNGRRSGPNARITELFDTFEMQARAGDAASVRMLAALREFQRAPPEPLPQEKPGDLWREWNASLAAVRTNAYRTDVWRRALAAVSADPVGTWVGEKFQVSIQTTPDIMTIADYAGAALLLIARRLPVESRHPAFNLVGALMTCRGVARDGASDDDLLSEALRQLGHDPQRYKAGHDSPRWVNDHRDRKRRENAAEVIDRNRTSLHAALEAFAPRPAALILLTPDAPARRRGCAPVKPPVPLVADEATGARIAAASLAEVEQFVQASFPADECIAHDFDGELKAGWYWCAVIGKTKPLSAVVAFDPCAALQTKRKPSKKRV